MAGDKRDGTFTLDRDYLAGQAREALGLFLAPVSGLYRAVAGPIPGHVRAEEPSRTSDITSV